MRLGVYAVGRMRDGPEQALTEDYLARADAAGRALGLGPVQVRELDPRKLSGKAAETEALLAAAPEGARIAALDEGGKALSSRAFADMLARWRDDGAREAAFLIGGAEGLTDAARERADLVLAFGPATWPHRMVRAMLAEQIYRAFSILGGGAYHKE